MEYLLKTTVCAYAASKSFIPPDFRYVIEVALFNEHV